MSVARALSPMSLDIVVVSNEETHVRVDRDCLRKLGVLEPEVFSSGLDAAQRLAKKPADVVLLDLRLEDMNGLEFVRLLRMHPRLRDEMPIVMASSGNTRRHVVTALGAGCAGYLIRPYSIQSLAGHLERAMNGSMGAFSASASALAFARGEAEPDEKEFFETLAARRSERDRENAQNRHLERGRIFLESGNYTKAIHDFSESIERDGMKPEAYAGLAEAWRGKGHPERYVECMKRAVRVCLLSGDTDKAALMARKMLAKASHEPNPCVELARELVSEGNFAGAASGYEAAGQMMLSSEGVDAKLFEEMKRACHFSKRPHRAAAHLARELGRSGRFGRPRALFTRIMGPTPEPVERTAKGVRAPVLHKSAKPRKKQMLGDVWSVVKYTIQSYVKDGEDVHMDPLGPGLDPLEEGA